MAGRAPGYRRAMRAVWGDPAPLASAPWPDRCSTVVLGAGVTGLVTAALLARAGRDVCVLEARHVGAGTTGRSTGKVSLLQGTTLSGLLSRHPEDVARRHLHANRAGQGWLSGFCAEQGVDLAVREAVTWAAGADEVDAARAEHDAARVLGLPVRWSEDDDLPAPSWGSTRLAEQGQLDPVALLDALARAVREAGGTIVEGARVEHVSWSSPHLVRTTDGRELRADDVVVATGAPVVDRGGYFSRLTAQRSYALALGGTPGRELPMMLSAGDPGRSVRDATDPAGRPVVLVGGYGHVVGRVASEEAHLDQLRAWARGLFDGDEVAAWSAQDQGTPSGVPAVGRMPLGGGSVWVATGYDKWGFTNGTAAGLAVSDALLGVDEPRVHVDGPLDVSTAARWLATNTRTGARMVSGAARAAAGRVSRALPCVGGVPDDAPPLCTHLGGTLSWNDAEQSWDCPLHGSRFAADGTVLDGPARRPLDVRTVTTGGN